ncbi:cytochrome P450 [Mycolicibacterium thermoresistibile]|jgi:cytochrome P450|uniref:Steroid C26-monooxygenase n=2 Tax=Mycolicibacterium thermoresistibile TaxID=1797 RepID=G7CL88_MYCT3|nr:cytochrome P450 [Mycolicibacterium thermoresistibile]EHI11164.1 cytochrome P450 [Mycolicibacterium thermoresistibile ATCC 19527]MCV7188573.1 cytochrome P450 [Mycolicibacterium thermoresistibile]GAT16444.1 cytochrome P450 [Mycolicibacterium thermoresistibile]SNW17634.1 cytochrome P450 [Mycolicibacterium thermoresistibile]
MTTTKLIFDPFSEDFFNGPYETYRRMREEAPVYYSEEYDFYALSRHADVAAAFKDFETYSSARGVDLAMVRNPEPPPHRSIIMMDPPEHRHMRSLLNRVFTPRAIQSLRSMVEEVVDDCLAAVDPAGFDAVQDFSALFPIEIISRMLGVPTEYRQQMRLWVDDFLHREPGEVEMSRRGVQAATEMAVYLYKLTKQRRHDLGDDLLSRLITAEIERENGKRGPLDNVEITQFAMLLGGAGAETVTKLIGNAAVVFAQHPDQWRLLLEDRSKIPAAVEELLRYEAPAQYNVRCSRREVTLHGVTIPAGKPVFLIGGSANRDPRAWTDPDTFDIERDRTEAQNLGFGYGIHSCLGAALARMESAIALERMLDFMPRYEVDWDNCRRVNMQNVAGWQNVPVRMLGR